MWGATFLQSQKKLSVTVSIHAPVWGATLTYQRLDDAHGFNPRTRVGCDWNKKPKKVSGQVSIHAPVWGATVGIGALSKMAIVSIHAPVWGATATASEGLGVNQVSIHAPVWGATAWGKVPSKLMMFQSTHPCGVRPRQKLIKPSLCGFNPRTRVGCDRLSQSLPRAGRVSIHAPVWGATTVKSFGIFAP